MDVIKCDAFKAEVLLPAPNSLDPNGKTGAPIAWEKRLEDILEGRKAGNVVELRREAVG